MSREIVLGDAGTERGGEDDPRPKKTDELRKGALTFRSRRGLRATERLLVEALPDAAPGRFLSGLDTEGSVALAARALWGEGPGIVTFHGDAYVAAKVSRVVSQNSGKTIQVLLAADLPGVVVPGEKTPESTQPFDLIALPFPKMSEAIFGREIIEEAHAALRMGGRLLASTDDEKGVWLRKVLKEIFGRVSLVREEESGVCLAAARTREKAPVRDHRHVIRCELKGRKLVLESRPGVFGHDRLDAGTRALAERLEVSPGERVLDIGCGYGALGLLAASLSPDSKVVLVDSSARAVALAARNAEANALPNATALLRANLEEIGEGFDLAVTNPPYYSNFRIARAFIEKAHAVLKEGGRLALVAKAKEQHEAIVREVFGEASVEEVRGGYGIVRAVKGRR